MFRAVLPVEEDGLGRGWWRWCRRVKFAACGWKETTVEVITAANTTDSNRMDEEPILGRINGVS